MVWLWILLGFAAFAVIFVLVVCYICFRMAFYSAPRQPSDPDVIDIPEGEIYEPYREKMEHWTRETRKLPQDFSANMICCSNLST